MEPVDASGPNHKHRNSSTKKARTFFPSPSLRPPQSFLQRNKSENPFERGVALTSASGHRGPARDGWTFRRANVDSSVCASASKTAERMRRGRGGRGADEESVFSLRLPAFGAGDESERRWRCGCRCSNLQRSVSPRSGGTGVALLWASAVGWAVPVASRSGGNRHGAN